MRKRRPKRPVNRVLVTISLRPEAFRVVRHAARFWRQRLKTFIRLAVEFRAADVLNSVAMVPLRGRDLVAFHRIWGISRDPGPLEMLTERGDGITGQSRKSRTGPRGDP